MSLSKKVLITVGIQMLLLTCSVLLFAHLFLLKGFHDIELNLIEKDVQRVTSVFNSHIEHLDIKLTDYAFWNETYKYTKTRDPAFIKENFEVPSMLDLKFNIVYMADLNLNEIYSVQYSQDNQKIQSVNDALRDDLQKQIKQIPTDSLKNGIKGLLFLNNLPMAIALRPILQSDKSGPIAGYLLYGAWVDETFIERVRDDTQLDLKFTSTSQLDEKSRSELEVIHSLKRPLIETKSDEILQAKVVFPDIHDKPSLFVKIPLVRSVYLYGQKTVYSFLLVELGSFLIASFLMIWLLNRYVISRVTSITGQVTEIGKSKGSKSRISLSEEDRDEIYLLTKSMNGMLDELEQNQIALNRSSRLSALGEMAGGVAHEVNNPLAIIVGYANQLQRLVNQEALDKSSIRDIAKKIEGTCQRIAKIIRALKSLVLDGEDDPIVEYKVSDLIHDTMTICNQKIASAKVDLRLLPISEELTATVRHVQISQVLMNIIQNSLESIGNLTDRWIGIEIQQIEGMIHIRISDSRLRIQDDIADLFMEKFFTSHQGSLPASTLSLSISKNLVENSGGRLWIDREAPAACFVVSIPMSAHERSSKVS